MGSITIPKIEVELPVYHGTEEKNLVKGVGPVSYTHLDVYKRQDCIGHVDR